MPDAKQPTEDDRFPPEIAQPVLAHMNADHRDDMVLICTAIGGLKDVESAEMVDLDRMGGDFVAATTDSADAVEVRITWSQRLSERGEIRAEVVRLVQLAQGASEP